jgi:hypothetical protein
MPPSITAPARAAAHRAAQVIADDRPVLDLAEDVDHHHVAVLQGLDDPRVLAAAGAAPLVQPGPLHHVVVVGAVGQELRRDGPPHQDRPRMGLQPVALELAVVAMAAQHPPGLFGGDGFHPLEQVVGHAGPPVGEAIEGTERGEGDQVFRGRLNAHLAPPHDGLSDRRGAGGAIPKRSPMATSSRQVTAGIARPSRARRARVRPSGSPGTSTSSRPVAGGTRFAAARVSPTMRR